MAPTAITASNGFAWYRHHSTAAPASSAAGSSPRIASRSASRKLDSPGSRTNQV